MGQKKGSVIDSRNKWTEKAIKKVKVSRKMSTDPNLLWCSKHECFHDKSEFSKNPNSSTGYQYYCKKGAMETNAEQKARRNDGVIQVF